MICSDWRDAPAGVLAPLFAAEEQRWAEELGWDLGPSLRVVEEARARGELPGLIVRSRTGEALAWSFHVLSHGLVQIGALTGRSAGAVRLLLEGICLSPEAQLAQGLSCFLFPVSTSVASALARQRFALQTQRYLSRTLAAEIAPPGSRLDVRPWQPEDSPTLVRLLARAYAGDAGARCFAPHGRLDEWAHYTGQLLSGPACGAFRPEWSVVAVAADGSPAGLVIATEIAPGTAHLAQVAVDPAHRGRRVGAALVAAACTAARRAGAERMTLIVGDHNAPARRLYDRLGFEDSSRAFLYAHRGPVPRRFSEPLRRSTEAFAEQPITIEAGISG